MTSNSLQSVDIKSFQNDLLSWYDLNKRDLPWRQTKDPYKIWLSEVMLQQTQVKTVIPYYERFLEKFPTVYDLAAADEQLVLKEWEGLGYYSRARNLHQAAQVVATTYNGKLPKDAKKLAQLKGIGPYTKGAILSIAFNEPHPAVDGNVIRVYSRVFHIEENITRNQTRKIFEQYVSKTISKQRPGDFNQSIMELGAIICTPRQPKCTKCPIKEHCKAYQLGIQTLLPVRDKQPKQKEISYATLLIVSEDKKIIIEQRSEVGLLANLWQFPMVPIDEIGLDHIEQYIFAEYGLKITLEEKRDTLKHAFTHLIWHLTVYQAKLHNSLISDSRIKLVPLESLDTYPFPVSHLNMMKHLKEPM